MLITNHMVNSVKRDDLTTLKKGLTFLKTFFPESYDLNHVLPSKNEQTLLHIAVKYGSKKVFLFLLEQGINSNITDGLGNTAAYYAVLHRQPEFLKCLKENGADFSQKNKCGKTLEEYIQVRPIKIENRLAKKALENILELNRFESNNTQFFCKESLENNPRQLEQKIADTSSLVLLAEVAIKQEENFLKRKKAAQKIIYPNKIQVITSSFFYPLPRKISQTRTEPLNLIKHNRPLNLSITPCFKR